MSPTIQSVKFVAGRARQDGGAERQSETSDWLSNGLISGPKGRLAWIVKDDAKLLRSQLLSPERITGDMQVHYPSARPEVRHGGAGLATECTRLCLRSTSGRCSLPSALAAALEKRRRAWQLTSC